MDVTVTGSSSSRPLRHPHRGTGCNGSKIGCVPSDRDANPVEQDHSGSELDTGEEISGKFVVARGDGAKVLEFIEEAFDEIAC